jgi:hypothetical protein
MDPNVLRDQLSQLHAELGNVQHVDPQSKQLLVEVLKDIQRLLEQQRADAASPTVPFQPGPAPANASLPDRLEKIAVQFEADHPTLAASSRRLIDLLGKAGL